MANLQVHILQRPKLAAEVFQATPKQLLEPVRWIFKQVIALAQTCGFNGPCIRLQIGSVVVKGHRQTPI